MRRSVRWVRWVFGLVGVLAVGVVAGWAGHEVLFPASAGSEVEESYALVAVAEGSVSSSMSLTVTASWPSRASGVNAAEGSVTSVEVSAGDRVHAGDALFGVNLRPMVVAQGKVPSFRALERGSVGDDVAQLQGLLRTLGFYAGSADGKFDAGVTRAVKRWQKGLGLDADGVVLAGDVMYLPSLPARVVLDADTVRVGAHLDGGEQVVKTLKSAPKFVLNVGDTQASRAREGTEVRITSPEGEEWTAVAGTQTVQEDGTVSIALAAEGDGSICGKSCDQVPVEGKTALDSRVITVPETSGLVVPDAALTTSASGSVELVGADGTAYPVEVGASADGMSIVSGEGVSAGLDVRVAAS